jgi:hypothetical protein
VCRAASRPVRWHIEQEHGKAHSYKDSTLEQEQQASGEDADPDEAYSAQKRQATGEPIDAIGKARRQYNEDENHCPDYAE